MTTPLTNFDYASLPTPSESRTARLFYRLALACALLPMSLGIAITCGYYLTEKTSFIIAGLYLIIVGAGLVLLGAAFLIVNAISSRKTAHLAGVAWKKRPHVLVLLLLLANLPVAFTCISLGIRVADSSYIDVLNETGDPIDDCVFVQRAAKISSGPIPPGKRYRAIFRDTLSSDGNVTLQITQGKKFLSPGFGSGWIRIHVKPGLTCNIESVH